MNQSYDDCYAYRDPVDPTIQFLYRPHSITALFCVIVSLVWCAYSLPPPTSLAHGAVRGTMAAALVFLFVGLMFLGGKGPFIRPHPAIWRLVLSMTVLYLMGLVAVLFLTVHQARQLLRYIDSSLGVPLPEKSYAEDCRFAWDAIKPQLDIFVVAHLVGWYIRALILRDEWICWVLSVMFEFCEYSLQHQLPNFAECWWDHWLLDVFGCNWLGIWLGMRTCEWLSMKRYEWRSVKDIPDLSGKLTRTIAQFSPHSWTEFNWATFTSFRGYLVSLMIISMFLLSDLNCFYLKYLLWVPPSHYLNGLRLCMHALMAAPATREAYQYFTDPACKRLGAHAWTAIAVIATESIICVKFGSGQFPAPWPRSVLWAWSFGLIFLILFPLYKFWYSKVSIGSGPNPKTSKPRRRSNRSSTKKSD